MRPIQPLRLIVVALEIKPRVEGLSGHHLLVDWDDWTRVELGNGG